MLEMLWECGCCVTLQLRLCEDESKVCLARNQASEHLKVLGSPALSDTFFTFARMVAVLRIDKTEEGDNLNLRYGNAAYNASIHKAAVALRPFLAHGDFQKATLQLDLEYGRDVLSTQYSKLHRLISEVNKAASATRSAPDLAAWIVQMLTLAFRTRIIAPSKATEQWLCQNRSTGAMGFWAACLVSLEAWVLCPCSVVPCKFSSVT